MTVEPTSEVVVDEQPAIWIGTRDDYDSERRYGDWLDATARPLEVMSAIRRIIEATPDGLGKAWDICELRGFAGWQPEPNDGLPVVLEVARGISIHGPAYGALAAQLGADSPALRADHYPHSYIGSWASLEDFVATVARESGWHETLDRLPVSMRPYVRIDLHRLARDARRQLTVIEHDQGVWVYDPRLW